MCLSLVSCSSHAAVPNCRSSFPAINHLRRLPKPLLSCSHFSHASKRPSAPSPVSSSHLLRPLRGHRRVAVGRPFSRPRAAISAMAAPEWGETAMLVIDMQKDFILPNSPMRVAGGEAIVPSVIRAVAAARERGALIVWVVREHDPHGRDVELFRRHFYANGTGPTAKGSEGAELVDGLVIEEEDYKLVKSRFSAFFDTNLHSLLNSNGIKNIVVVGVQTPNCIRQTVFDAVALNYQSVTVIVDATAAATPEVHIANIFDMKNVGVVTNTLEEWCGSKG